MQRIVLFLITILTMSTIDAQTLTERQKGLAACACLMAQGDMNRLEPAVRMALDNGVTINELKEAFSQLYAYTGFPRSLNALGVLNKVLENKQLLIIPDASHCDLYDGGYTEPAGNGEPKNLIPWDKLAEFFNKNLK